MTIDCISCSGATALITLPFGEKLPSGMTYTEDALCALTSEFEEGTLVAVTDGLVEIEARVAGGLVHDPEDPLVSRISSRLFQVLGQPQNVKLTRVTDDTDFTQLTISFDE